MRANAIMRTMQTKAIMREYALTCGGKKRIANFSTKHLLKLGLEWGNDPGKKLEKAANEKGNMRRNSMPQKRAGKYKKYENFVGVLLFLSILLYNIDFVFYDIYDVAHKL